MNTMVKTKLKRIRVDFECDYLERAEEEAKGRVKRAKDLKREQKYGQLMKDKPKDNRIGCRAEAAAAQHYGLEYNPGPVPDFWDVGKAEIRGTDWWTGHLLGHDGWEEDTKQNMIFILGITPLDERFAWLVGWSYGYEIFRPELWGDHWNKGRPCFAKPQHELKDLDRLVCIDEIIQEK